MAMTHVLINFSPSPHLGVCGVPLGLRGKGMVSSSCIVFVMHVEYLLLHVMCVLIHVHVATCGCNVSVIMCILVWVRVHVCVAPPILWVRGRWRGCYGGFLSIIIIVASGGVANYNNCVLHKMAMFHK